MDNQSEGRKSVEGRPVKDPASAVLQARDGGESNSVVVVVDATKELSLGALEWALDRVVEKGDALTLLGVLHQIPSPSTLPFKLAIHAGIIQLLGYKQRPDTNAKQIDEEVSKKLEHFKNASMLQDIHSKCDQLGINLEVKIAAGPYSKQVTVKQALELRATWVILDRHMKKDKKYLIEHLDCNLVLMKRNKEGNVIRVCNRQLMVGTAQSQEELSIDSSMIVSREVAATISRGFEQNVAMSVRDKQHQSQSEMYMSPLSGPMHPKNYSVDLARIETTISDVDAESGMVSLNVGSANGLCSGHHGDAQSRSRTVGLLLPGSLGTIEFESDRHDAIHGQSNLHSWEGVMSSSPSSEVSMRSEGSYITSNSSSPKSSSLTGVHHMMNLSVMDSSLAVSHNHMHNSSAIEVPMPRSFRHVRSSSISEISPTRGNEDMPVFASISGLEYSPTRKSLSSPLSSVSSLSPTRKFYASPLATATSTRNSISSPGPAPSSARNSVCSPGPTSSSRNSSSLPVPTSSHGATNSPFNLSDSSCCGTTPVSNVYHPAPIPVLPRRNFERQLLSDLLNKQDLITDRQHFEKQQYPSKQEGENTVFDARKALKTPPPERSTPIETVSGVYLEDLSRHSSPLLTTIFDSDRDKDTDRDLDPLDKYSMKAEEEAIEKLERISIPHKRVTSGPPPLCSICKHKSPEFGRPPRKFTYAELEAATSNFSSDNFLAEGGFGFVYKGLLKEGQAVAVKQHKLASTQGDLEFCSEVEVLSCAQHRNLVTLIGYCVESRRRLLVYEFVCNQSLDWHLSSQNADVLPWGPRQKIAVGAARGLRYLHEECRVGCIVHRDMRPNNILLTHDYVPMVGDFGLARWQPSGDTAVETRVIGTLGYLAPEYAESGQITEKADVYSFGVVLLELITGRKAIDPARSRGQHCLTEWARPLLEERAYHELLDPRLAYYDDYELYCMVHAASLCIRKEPSTRPKMSQVLRILEGDKEHHGPSESFPNSNNSLSSAEPYVDHNGRQMTESYYGYPRSGSDNFVQSTPVAIMHNRAGSFLEERFGSDRSPIPSHRSPYSQSIRLGSSPKIISSNAARFSYNDL